MFAILLRRWRQAERTLRGRRKTSGREAQRARADVDREQAVRESNPERKHPTMTAVKAMPNEVLAAHGGGAAIRAKALPGRPGPRRSQ